MTPLGLIPLQLGTELFNSVRNYRNRYLAAYPNPYSRRTTTARPTAYYPRRRNYRRPYRRRRYRCVLRRY